MLLDELGRPPSKTEERNAQKGKAWSNATRSSIDDVSAGEFPLKTTDFTETLRSAITGTQPPDKQQLLASLPGVKISVAEDGWYRATQADLVAYGFSPTADLRSLQLYADGVEVPIRINSSKNTGALRPGDSIEFYGVALDTISDSTREYWLISGDTPGKRIKTQVLKNLSSNKVVQSFEYSVEKNERLLYFSGLLNGDKENFFGQVINGAAVNQTLFVQNLINGASRLEVALQGVTLQDHVVAVQVNGIDVGVLRFAGQDHAVAQLSLRAGLLNEGNNIVSLQRVNGDMDISLVDYVRLVYPHTYHADGDQLEFTLDGCAQVTGFRVAEVMLLDITEPNSIVLYQPKMEKADDGYRFGVQTSDRRRFLALMEPRVVSPSSITRNGPSNWSSQGVSADLVVITHRDFRNSVQPLVELRRREGLTVAVVDVEDVYDEFSYGAHSAFAIRDFLNWSRLHWLRVPKFVLLVGDGSFDPRNYLGNGAGDLVPARLIDTALIETASDDWFVDFDGDGAGDMAIGRLPVRTAAEAEAMISKIVAYSPANSDQKVLMVADRLDGQSTFNFEAASNELVPLLALGTGVEKIFRGDNPTSITRDQIINGINQGPLLVNYIGHGSVEVWTGAPILSASDAAELNNPTGLPLFLMMTCLNGYYQDPTRESLAEALMRTDVGGAVAVWASSGMTEPGQQLEMNKALYHQLFGTHSITLGEAVMKAKRATSSLDVRRTWILFGDPTLRIR
jgi:hypothetical protein